MKLMEQQLHELGGLRVHIIPTDKYKTNTFVFRFKAPLNEETVTERALLPYVLQSATEKLPSVIRLRQYLEELYGSSLAVDVSKKGEDHIISIYVDIANEVYLHDAPPLFEKALSMLSDIVLHPATEGNGFLPSIVESEKRALLQRIEATYDDKMRYANERLIEEMCKVEPYRLSAHGKKEIVSSITNESLYQYYQKVLAEDEMDLYIVGDISENAVDLVSKYFSISARPARERNVLLHKRNNEEKEVVEKQELKQSKLHIGYRTFITYKDEDYFALQLFNGLFGGFSHSKLFVNVREKNSLAYYAASRFESHKGLLFVMSGIEAKNYEKAVEIIKEQMLAMQNGDFSEEEMHQTKSVIQNQILEAIDTPRGFVEMLYHGIISDRTRPVEEWLTGIESVTKEEIVKVAKNIELDTIYFLQGTEGE
ncbi:MULTISPECIES: EF-P 5-aminopentanol modification-associated protein YfmF [Bacillus cereus group]|uniref:Peptidase M16 C-terminal domain-containing protein n=1 Tax=Bacillus thuringiensis TaxID=1428 RepID=A0A1C4FKC1_BACTU|nr:MULTISPECIES: pitrilysin family protein [Bacillus cereus group]MCC2324376.1 insulinase family protein [Bacillus wiedmannii]MDP1458787.1 pitrilysin family protein [Bacillus wiedmannii]MED3022046.1 pitrilysin family protein [Bacillus wiedmannii]OTX93966.1 peptidase M16 [Bacillus thuringiensis serovar wratislaviensis]OUB55744.1 peptidase M16 [Bacillus thuringiensis serovar sylvestriensis]